MYGRKNSDIEQTLTNMINEAREVCRYNQPAMVETIAEWLGNDRRFDGMDSRALASEAIDAKQHGRELDLTPRMNTAREPQHANGPAIYGGSRRIG